MRVALVAESFLPHMNGVTGSVLHVLRHLEQSGHEALVIAPGSGPVEGDLHGARTSLLRSFGLPSYPAVRIATPRTAHLARTLREFAPDVVHLASPFVLGWQAVVAADALRVPTVAVYQTDVVAYARRYGVPQTAALAARHVSRLHRRATLNLVPSGTAMRQLEELGVDRLALWGRGVDTERFDPRHRREAWRARHAPGETIVGYVGRLAPEKQVEDLVALAGIPGIRIVIVGEGPSRPALERQLPEALFLGHLSGAELAEAVASFDVFVHPGESETFGQTIQEALASGVPVVATGRGGPLDLVRNSVDGWLYRPGDLGDLRARVADLSGDEAKRRAFGVAARDAMAGRSWDAVCRRLVEHYGQARSLRAIDDGLLVRTTSRPALPVPAAEPRAWRRYVALGDSITEGLCDGSRVPDGVYRGWADRLAQLLALSAAPGGQFRYANLAVRSRKVHHLIEDQLPQALAMRPDLVSILIGGNDLVGPRCAVPALAAEVEKAVRALRAEGCDVLLATPFLPRRRASLLFARRFSDFAAQMRRIAAETGAILLDLDAHPALGELSMWADDKVHLRPRGHRFVAYRAADVLGVPDAEALGRLEEAFHAEATGGAETSDPASVDEDDGPKPGWLTRDAMPWIWRRLRGRTAGDGIEPKHAGYVVVPRPGSSRRAGRA